MSILTVDRQRNDGVGHTLAGKLNVNMPIVFVSRSESLDFNEEVLSLKGKKYCLIDFTELGYDWHREYGHHWGVNTDKFPGVFHMDKWRVFDDFIKENPPAITFCRELLEEDVKDNVLPISYPCFIPPQPIQTFEQFNNRIWEVFYTFGISHEYRKELHGAIWAKSGKYGYTVADNIYLLDHFIANEHNPRKWASIHIPWWSRQPYEVINERNGSAKISISIAGAGRSCFRHTEAPVNSVMLMWEDNLAWHKKDWIHGVNCIKCEQGKEIEMAVEWLEMPKNLYQVYLEGMKTVDKFRFENYVPYLESLINKA